MDRLFSRLSAGNSPPDTSANMPEYLYRAGPTNISRNVSQKSDWSIIEPVEHEIGGYSTAHTLPNEGEGSLSISNVESHAGSKRSPPYKLDLQMRSASGATVKPSDPDQSSRQAAERPPFPPDILKGELDLKERIFDGNYSDVHRAEWEGQIVAVKVLRCLKVSGEAMERKRNRELITWWELDHPSILPLLGFVEDIEPIGPVGAMVSPVGLFHTAFCQHSNSTVYLRKPVSSHERITLWREVIEGIAYLHGNYPMIVHGDLKPANILIDDNKHARICDFGLVRLVQEQGDTGLTTTTAHTGTTRYNSPELILNARAKPTAASDVYALGCLGLEFVLSKRPYDHRNDAKLIIRDIKNEEAPARRPKKLMGEIARFWDQLEACWDQDPTERPTAPSIGGYISKYGDSLVEALLFPDSD